MGSKQISFKILILIVNRGFFVTNIIVVFQKIEEARGVKSLLMKHGYGVVAACNLGSQALDAIDGMTGGVVVCGYRYADMLYSELKENLPEDFEMLLVASKKVIADETDGNVVCLEMPIKINDLLSTLEMIVENQERIKRKRRSIPKTRTKEEQQIIDEAKAVLMERNHMTEPEAFRYIQKCSMDKAVNLVETAQMILTLLIR